jgi:hypothetical protein
MKNGGVVVPMYEVELRRNGGVPEFRLTDKALAVGDELQIVGKRWRVEELALPQREAAATVRYVCLELNGDQGNAAPTRYS